MPTMPTPEWRAQRLRELPDEDGIYALCDLDEVPLFIGECGDSIRESVRAVLHGASGPVLHRQVDPWEVGFIWAWPVERREDIPRLWAHLLYDFDSAGPLVNAAVPKAPTLLTFDAPERIRVQVMPEELIAARRHSILRFPRQVQHFNNLVDYILNTQDKPHLRRALQVYFDRLSRYFREFLGGE